MSSTCVRLMLVVCFTVATVALLASFVDGKAVAEENNGLVRRKRDIITKTCGLMGCKEGMEGVFHYECCGDLLSLKCCPVLEDSFKTTLIIVGVVLAIMIAVSCVCCCCCLR